jgi:hypothetical protein
MHGGAPAPPFGPTTSVVEAFLDQLRHVPEQPPHGQLHRGGTPTPAARQAVAAMVEPAQRQVAVQAAQEAVAAILGGLHWGPEADGVQQYVEQIAPEVAAVLVLQGYVSPGALAEDYDRVYVTGWQGVFGVL